MEYSDIDDDDDVSRLMIVCHTCGAEVHPDTAWGDCESCDGSPGSCPAYCSETCYYSTD